MFDFLKQYSFIILETFLRSLPHWESLFTIAALSGALYWFFRNRRSSPKANISHDVQTFPFNSEYNFVRVTALFENVGEVLIELISTESSVQRAVYDEEESKLFIKETEDGNMVLDVDEHGMAKFYNIHTIDRTVRTLIEPGENERLYYDFIIPININRTVFRTQIINKASLVKRWPKDIKVKSMTWSIETIHIFAQEEDIMKKTGSKPTSKPTDKTSQVNNQSETRDKYSECTIKKKQPAKGKN